MLIEGEGEADVAGHTLQTRDALVIVAEDIIIDAKENAHILVLEYNDFMTKGGF